MEHKCYVLQFQVLLQAQLVYACCGGLPLLNMSFLHADHTFRVIYLLNVHLGKIKVHQI